MTKPLGETFKQFRISRGLTLRQVAHGHATSTTSRFETGSVDISMSSALNLMYSVGLDAKELDYRRGHQIPDPFAKIVHGDRQGVRHQFENFLVAQRPTALTKLALKVTPMLNLAADSDYQIPQALEQRIADLLAYPLLWGNFEATILMACVPFASIELASLLWQRINDQAQAQPNWEPFTVAFTALACLTRCNETLKQAIHDDLFAIRDQNNKGSLRIGTTPLISAGIALSADQSIETELNALKSLQNDALANFLEISANQISAKHRPWHNPSIEDRYDNDLNITPNEVILAGPTLAKLRKQRGLRLTDVVDDWTPSTQSRFEAGKTKLAFSRMVSLLDTLMVSFSQVVEGQDDISSFEHQIQQISAMGQALDQYSRSDFFAIIDRFATNHADLPKALMTMQRFAIRMAIATFATPLCHGTDELVPQLSPTEQNIVVEYVQQIDQISHLDVKMLAMTTQGLDAEHIGPVTEALFEKTIPYSVAESALFASITAFTYGPLYCQNRQLLDEAANYFQPSSRFDADWRIARGCTLVSLLDEGFNGEPIDSNAFMSAFQTLLPLNDIPYGPKRWLQFAIDRDYSKLGD